MDLLTKAKEIAAGSGNVPDELTSHLQKALDIARGLDDYLEIMTTQESEPLAELYKYVFALYTLSLTPNKNKEINVAYICIHT